VRLPRWRKATWALVIWCALILIWAIAGVAGNECAEETTELNQSACEAGTGIGVALILLIGFFGFVFFSLIWIMSRPRRRQCPGCGEDVKKGVTACPACGFDFLTQAPGGPGTAPQPLPAEE
jgi:TRAP-type C4-dicarboxylate transport system permease small subunit